MTTSWRSAQSGDRFVFQTSIAAASRRAAQLSNYRDLRGILQRTAAVALEALAQVFADRSHSHEMSGHVSGGIAGVGDQALESSGDEPTQPGLQTGAEIMDCSKALRQGNTSLSSPTKKSGPARGQFCASRRLIAAMTGRESCRDSGVGRTSP